jgi:hypothetical protein
MRTNIGSRTLEHTSELAFISPAAEAIFQMYEPTFIKSMPHIFETSIRSILQEEIIDGLAEMAAMGSCQAEGSYGDGEFVNFNELFDGEGSYGNVFALLKDFFDSEYLLAEEGMGLSSSNDLVRQFTNQQSGEEGQLQFAQTLYSLLLANLKPIGIHLTEFDAHDLVIDNLDTCKSPVVLLRPNIVEPDLLENHISLGSTTPLLTMLEIMIRLSGDPLLSSSNNLDIGLGFVGADIFAALRARIVANELISFPLRKIADVNCWLSLSSIHLYSMTKG